MTLVGVLARGAHGNFTVSYSDVTSNADLVPSITFNPFGFTTPDALGFVNTTSQIDGMGPVFNGIEHEDQSTGGGDQSTGTLAFSAIDPAKRVRSISWTVLDVRSEDDTFSSGSGVRFTCMLRPVAVDNPISSVTIEAVSQNLLTNDSDGDNNIAPATVALIAPTGAGITVDNPVVVDGLLKGFEVEGEGTWSVDNAGLLTFTPVDGFTGDPTDITYTVQDADGNTSNAATVSVEYDEQPVAENDTFITSAAGPITITPLGNDTQAGDLFNLSTIVLTGTGAPVDATLATDGKTLTLPGQGEWTVADNGEVTFTPLDGFMGTPTPAAYVVSDTQGRTTNEALITLTIVLEMEITAADDGTIAVDGSNGDTSSVSVLDNDTLGGDPITDPSLVSLTPVALPVPTEGSITLNADGTITVAPGTTTGTYTISYQICEVANPTNCAT